MGDESLSSTLYVGNLDPGVTKDFLYALFGQIGEIKDCKIFRELGYKPYAYVEFIDPNIAAKAMHLMNRRVFLDEEMKVTNWETRPLNQPKSETTDPQIFAEDTKTAEALDSIEKLGIRDMKTLTDWVATSMNLPKPKIEVVSENP